jgi:type IV secretion system protein TrbG
MKHIIFPFLFAANYVACWAQGPIAQSKEGEGAIIGTTKSPAENLQSSMLPTRGGELFEKLSHLEETRSVGGQPKLGAEMTKEWETKSIHYQRQSKINGSVVLTFNAALPTIVCAILQVTDIELEAGEEITSLNIGDFARWIVTSVKSNQGELERPHVIVKPLAEGLKTSLVITTTERTYHLLLQSSFDEFMHYVTFTYPSENEPEKLALKKRKAAEEHSRIAKEREKLPKPIIPGPPIQEVRYSISGRTKWRPIGIYTDGIKTYIKMPDTIGYIEAPVLYLLRGRQRVLVNYRIHNNLYVIDTVLDRAEMTIGKERITLTRRS